MLKRLATLILTGTLGLTFSYNAQAGGNPGKTAMHCVSISKKNTSYGATKVYFRNTCSRKIFIIYCGTLKYNRKRCGDGPRGHYYTHSKNLRPGQRSDIVIKSGGRYRYGACIGGIGFGTKGFKSYSGGRFSCTKTGSYARKERERSSGSSYSGNRYNNDRYNNNRYNNNRYNNNNSYRKLRVTAYGKNRYAASRYSAIRDAKSNARSRISRHCRSKGYRGASNFYRISNSTNCRYSNYSSNRYICSVKMKGTCYR